MKTKFLIQKFKAGSRYYRSAPMHDFSLALVEAVAFQKFMGFDDYILKYTYEIHPEKHKNFIPVGSLEFVIQYYQMFHPEVVLKPINIPEQLTAIEFSRRGIQTHIDPKILKGEYYFIKSNEVFKMPPVYSGTKEIKLIGNYQASELIAIESEWRCFIHKKNLVGLKHYSGDFTVFPDVEAILDMMEAYTEAPAAYTLDVGVDSNKYISTFVIECHDFFSCGLYGFDDHRALLQMLTASHYEKVKGR